MVSFHLYTSIGTMLYDFQWTVVEFSKENRIEISTVSMDWIYKDEEQSYCYWPSQKAENIL